jgi:hypothetical protein
VRLKPAYLVSALALVAGVSLAFGAHITSEFGPLPSVSGAPAIRSKPAEFNCTLCHLPDVKDNLNTPGGYVKILDLPKTYTTGQTYRLRVRLWSDSTVADPARKWGFQITAVRARDGEGLGTFVLDDAESLQIVSGANGEDPGDFGTRSYVEHTDLGDRETLAGPAEWTFSWKAPDVPADTAFFFCAGNAANGSDDPSGDFIFTTAETVLDVTTPAKAMTWGAVKRKYR